MQFSEKTALITGAASGIGAATAALLASRGAKVAGVDIQRPLPTEAWPQAENADVGTLFLHGVDVSSESDVREAVEAVNKAIGPINILVNAAGISSFGSAEDVDESEWDRTIDVNLKSAYLLTKHTVPGMKKKQAGSIIHVGSTAAFNATENLIAYCSSKGGLVSLTKAMAWDYGKYGIRVNCVCPGAVDTPLMNPTEASTINTHQMISRHALGRFGKSSEIASAIAFLASADASFITGHSLNVDGGWTAGGPGLIPPAEKFSESS